MQAGRSSTMRAHYCKTRTKPSRKRAPLQARSLPNFTSATQRRIPSKFCRKLYGHFSRRCQTCTSDCTIGTTKTWSMGYAMAGHEVRCEEVFHVLVCVVVAPQHPFARRVAIPIVEVAAQALIARTRED